MLIIGSKALEFRAPQLLDRTPLDWDFVGTMYECTAAINAWRECFTAIYPAQSGKKLIARGPGRICEFEIAWPGSTAAAILEMEGGQPVTIDGLSVVLSSLDGLFCLKHSHRFLKNSPHFLKTMRDWRTMRDAGAQLRYPDWVRAREKETYNYAHPKLNVQKDQFFTGDGVQYLYDHDSIHEAMRHLDRPAYTYFKPADRDVMCDRGMFEAAAEDVRLYSVVEESYVLALERSQIPHPGALTPLQSFEMALMKVCTSITSGWWREYAYEHYHGVRALYDDSYVRRFWAGVSSGIVKKLAA